jgi:aerobic-type carbon monoxide dehydrogenase small subunit (CoxS/CutS family)
MDKTGCAIGNVKKVLVHKDEGAKRAVALQAKQPRGKWVTSIEAIKANGEVLKPLVILKGKTLNASWMLGEADRWWPRAGALPLLIRAGQIKN